MKTNGADKLFSRMIDREYAEMADLPEDQLYEEFDEEDVLVDEQKDTEYYTNRIAKGYGLVDNPLHRGSKSFSPYQRG